MNLMEEMKKNGGVGPLGVATGSDVESGTINGDSIGDLFPLKGKDVLECPPRMRFAPSPTGRYVTLTLHLNYFSLFLFSYGFIAK